MSTTGTAVADEKSGNRSDDERSTALGPGVIRLLGGAYIVPVRSEIQVRCLGPLAYWNVSTTFVAPTDQSEDGLFLFPLPPEAALLGFSLNAEQLMPGKLSIKALTELPDSAELPLPDPELVEAFGDETLPVLSLRLSPWKSELFGGAEFTVQLDYASGLPTIDGRICLTCPTFISKELSQDQATAVKITVAIEDGNELVDDPEFSRELTSSKEDDTLLLTGSYEEMDHALKVTFRPGRTQMPVTRLRRSDDHFVFSIFPPTSIPASPQRRDIVFAIDASENMDAEGYDRIKTDLMASLRSLDENDRFALVTFGRDIDGYDGGEFCDIDQIEAACSWLESTRPQGRADVQPLLQRIQSLPSQQDRQLCIFLLAGGHVGNEPAILRSLDFDQSDRRYYTVGLGPTVKQAFLRRLALLTRGRCEVSTDGGCAEALSRLLGQTRALLAEVTFEDQETSDIRGESLVPSVMTSLTPQGPVHCLGEGTPSSLRFRSKDETGVFFAGTVNAQPTDNPALAGVWASLRVRELLDSVKLTTGAKRKGLKAEASGLASAQGILTEDTVLVLEHGDNVDIQYSAQPSLWAALEPKEKKGNVSNKDSAAPFDWRKGLVARKGLFKGSKAGSGSESGESSGRYGLRSKATNSSESTGKPRLDRGTRAFSVQETEVEAEVEIQDEELQLDETDELEVADSVAEMPEEAPVSSADDAEAPVAESPVAESPVAQAPATKAPAAGTPVAVPVAVAASHSPVVHLQADPLREGRLRLEGFHDQLQAYDTDFALAALQGLPRELSPRGGELPRVLAQTVAHLEKRGFYAHAVSVLGLLLRDNPSPEVEKKMETLLVAWSDSLSEAQLPEAMQILNLGQRICGGSELLAQKCEHLWQVWSSKSGDQAKLPEVVCVRASETPDVGALLSDPQLELAQLKQAQSQMMEQIADLKKSLQEQACAIPEMIQSVATQTASAVVAQVPAPLSQQQTAVSPPQEGSQRVVDDTDGEPLSIRLPGEPPLKAAPSTEARDSQPERAPAVEAEAASVDLAKENLEEQVPSGQDESSAGPGPVPADASLTEAAVQTPAVQTPVAAKPVVEEPVAEEPPAEPAIVAAPAVAEAETESPVMVEPEPVFSEEENTEDLVLTQEELTELVLKEPRTEKTRRIIEASLTEPKELINFFRDLVKQDASEPYHSLSLARAYRAADQTKVAVVHYQKYLRSEKDSQAYLELAEAYDELGKANLSASARKSAEAYSS